MGTRGLFGFFFRGRYYIFWNQYDSYLSGLGQQVVNEIMESGTLALFIRLLEHLVEFPLLEEDIDNDVFFKYVIQGADEADVLRCKANGNKDANVFAKALRHGFDDGLQLCSSLDSPPDLRDLFIQFAYFVNVDEMKLLVYSGSLQYFELSLTDVTIGEGWIEQLETGKIPYCQLPHPAIYLETAIAAMSERGYVFKQWISKRSVENVIGEFIRHDSEQSVAVKLFFGESLLRGSDCAWRRMPARGVRCCKREQAVAELLLESQAACVNHPPNIVPIVEIIHRGSSVHDVAGVVLHRAPSDLDCYFAEVKSIVPIDRETDSDKTREVEFVQEVLTRLRTWVCDLLEALKWFHDRDLILLDLKSSNVIIHENGHLMVCDFDSVCKQSPQCAAKLHNRQHDVVGEEMVNRIAEKAAEGEAKWAKDWAPFKCSDLAPGFKLDAGEATALQDFFCLGNLLDDLRHNSIATILRKHALDRQLIIDFCNCQIAYKAVLENDYSRVMNETDAHLIIPIVLLCLIKIDGLNSDFLATAEVERVVHTQILNPIDRILDILAPSIAT
jgi:hypothetical protein